MKRKGYIAVSFRSLPKDFRQAIESGSVEQLEKHLARSVFSYATKAAAKHYFNEKNPDVFPPQQNQSIRRH